MAINDPTLIERAGSSWSFSFDTRPAPEYLVLAFRGRTLPTDTGLFLAAIEENLACLAGADGRFYPTIVDLSALPPPSLGDVKAGWGMVGGVARRHSYLAFQISEAQRRAPLFGVFLGALPRLMPGRFALTTSRAEAVAAIRAYHAQKR